MRSEVRDLHRKLAAPSVYVTRDQVEAMTMADRIVAMQDGIVQQIGTPTEIYERPVNRFVASFIGSPAMNFMDASVVREAGSVVLETPFGRIEWPAGHEYSGTESVTLGLRPESITIGRASSDVFGGSIDSLEYMGATTLIHVTSGEEKLRLMAFGALEINEGASVGLDVAVDELHLFDRESGVRLDV